MIPNQQERSLELLEALRKLNSANNKTLTAVEFNKLFCILSHKYIQRIKTVLIKNAIIKVQCKGLKRGDGWLVTYCSKLDPNVHMSDQTLDQVRKLTATYKRNSYMRKKGKQIYTSEWLVDQIKNIKQTFESNNCSTIVQIDVNFLSVQKHKI